MQFINMILAELNSKAELFGCRKVRLLHDSPIEACLRYSKIINIIDNCDGPLEGRRLNIHLKCGDDVVKTIADLILDESMNLLFSDETRDIFDGKPLFHSFHTLKNGDCRSNKTYRFVNKDLDKLDEFLLSARRDTCVKYEEGEIKLQKYIVSDRMNIHPCSSSAILQHPGCPENQIVAYSTEQPVVTIFYETDEPVRNTDAKVNSQFVWAVRLMIGPWYLVHKIVMRDKEFENEDL